jgi:hypothetical protein
VLATSSYFGWLLVNLVVNRNELGIEVSLYPINASVVIVVGSVVWKYPFWLEASELTYAAPTAGGSLLQHSDSIN